MILREVALLGKIQSRCDGVGSEVNVGKPSVNRALRLYQFAEVRPPQPPVRLPLPLPLPRPQSLFQLQRRNVSPSTATSWSSAKGSAANVGPKRSPGSHRNACAPKPAPAGEISPPWRGWIAYPHARAPTIPRPTSRIDGRVSWSVDSSIRESPPLPPASDLRFHPVQHSGPSRLSFVHPCPFHRTFTVQSEGTL